MEMEIPKLARTVWETENTLLKCLTEKTVNWKKCLSEKKFQFSIEKLDLLMT